jgi:hypothetical protein
MRTAENFYKHNQKQQNIQLYGLPSHMIKSYEKSKKSQHSQHPGQFMHSSSFKNNGASNINL